MSKVICFYDIKATSVSPDADLISLGIIAVQDNKVVKSIYSEFTDFNIDKCDDWVKENVVGKLTGNKGGHIQVSDGSNVDNCDTKIYGDTLFISTHLKQWLSQFEDVEFWADERN